MRDFEHLGLPGKSQEAFLHTDVEAFYAPRLRSEPGPDNPESRFQGDFPLRRSRPRKPALLLRRRYLPGRWRPGTAPRCSGLQPARGRHELSRTGRALLRPLARTDKDGTVALNTALVQEGFFLYVPRNVQIEAPAATGTSPARCPRLHGQPASAHHTRRGGTGATALLRTTPRQG